MKPHLCLVLMALGAWAQQPEAKPIVVSGKVMHAGSATALKKAKVTLLPSSGEAPAATAESDDEGRYKLETQKPGRYRVRAEKTGYETAAWGATKPNYSVGRPITLTAGQEMTGMDVLLPKHGVIAGKVLNSENEPVGNALVLAWTTRLQGTRVIRVPLGSVPAMSNDLGEFRVSQLPPNKYRVCASPLALIQPSQAPPGSGPMKVEEIDSTVCYPNVGSLDLGAEVEILDGTELPGIDLRLPRVKSVAIRGKVNGLPAGGSGISVLALTQKGLGNAGMSYSRKTIVDASSGKFELKGVLPGQYILHSLPTGLGAAAFLVKSPVEVGDQPMENFDVNALSPFDVKGTVAMPENPPAKLENTRVVLTSEDEIMASVPNAQPGADGTFKLDSMLPGKYRLFVTPLPWQLHIASVKVGEKEFIDGMIEIATGAAPLEIKLDASEASIFGPMMDGAGKPAPGGWALLVPEPRRAYRTRYVRADQTGMYRLEAVAPGEYQIMAFENLEPNNTEDEEYLKPHLSRAKRVKVDSGSKQTVELKQPGR